MSNDDDAEPQEPEEREVVLKFTTSRPERVVGTELRPSRALTAGPRRSDRWLAWCLGAALLALGASSVWTAARHARHDDRLRRIEDALDRLLLARS
jgi:Golgi nucleoside diphosphatase